MTICIIPARGGSRRIPHKNIKEFHGKPIIEYSIEVAINSGLFDKVIVSTDSVDIAVVAADVGATVWWRDPAYGNDEIGTQEVVKECLDGMRVTDDELVCCLYATAPLLSLYDLRVGYHAALYGGNSYAFSVGYPPLQDAGQFYWGFARSFKHEIPLIGGRTHLVPIDASRVCDINTMDDWNRALKMYEELNK